MLDQRLRCRINDFGSRLEREDVCMHGFILSVGGEIKAKAYYAPFREGEAHRMYSRAPSRWARVPIRVDLPQPGPPLSSQLSRLWDSAMAGSNRETKPLPLLLPRKNAACFIYIPSEIGFVRPVYVGKRKSALEPGPMGIFYSPEWIMTRWGSTVISAASVSPPNSPSSAQAPGSVHSSRTELTLAV